MSTTPPPEPDPDPDQEKWDAIRRAEYEAEPVEASDPDEEDVIYLGSIQPHQPEPSGDGPDDPRRRRRRPYGDAMPSAGRRYGGGGDGDGQVVEIVNPRAPREMARQFLGSQGMVEGRCILRAWRGQVFRWTEESHYRAYPEADLRSAIYAWAEQTRKRNQDGSVAGWCEPSSPLIGNIVDALAALVLIQSGIEAPTWVEPIRPDEQAPVWLGPAEQGDRPPAGEFIAVGNGVLHLPSVELWPSTPEFFAVTASPVVWDEAAAAPQWQEFLGQLWPDEPDSIEALQEVFGYIVSGNTTLQSIPMLIGPPRSGKGTIARVLTSIVGSEATCSPSLAGLGGNFGLEPLIGKSLAMISDARIGQKTDRHAVLERLLTVSGEDGVTVDRKHQSAWTGRLPTRFFILSNDLPQIPDTSGALESRLVLMKLQRSFAGREDRELTQKLLAEAPGILRWAVEGWHRLRARGRFIQPESGRDGLRVMRDLASPVWAFLCDCCEIADDAEVGVDELYRAYQEWIAAQGRKAGGKEQFGRDLRAAFPKLEVSRPGARARSGEKPERPRIYSGIRLRLS
jgi:putative DNA primase/helicase